MGKFIINCDEATAICNKNQYKEAGLWEKVQLSLHLLVCKKCGHYSKQNVTVTNVCKQHLQESDCSCKLKEQDKERMQEKINEQLK